MLDMGFHSHNLGRNNLQTSDHIITVPLHLFTIDMIAGKNIREMLYIMAGPEYGTSPEDIDLKTAAETYLIHYGMGEETLKLLEGKLM